MATLWKLIRRTWRGAWKPTYKPNTGWWYLLDVPWRIRDVFCAVFLFFLGPPWIAFLCYEALARGEKRLFVGVAVLGAMWVVLFGVAYLAGGSTARRDAPSTRPTG
jgi:hypothetical protein